MNEDLRDVRSEEKALSKLEDRFKEGKLSDTTFEKESAKLVDIISTGHDLKFVGRVGQFTPIKSGHGAGILYRVNAGKNYAAPDSTGYRWMESERLKAYGKEEWIDRSFYNKLVDDAIETIEKYGDFTWFVSNDPYIPATKPSVTPEWLKVYDDLPEEIPFTQKGVYMIDKIKSWLKLHIDYRIVGEYYDVFIDEKGIKHYIKKYNKKYYFKK